MHRGFSYNLVGERAALGGMGEHTRSGIRGGVKLPNPRQTSTAGEQTSRQKRQLPTARSDLKRNIALPHSPTHARTHPLDNTNLATSSLGSHRIASNPTNTTRARQPIFSTGVLLGVEGERRGRRKQRTKNTNKRGRSTRHQALSLTFILWRGEEAPASATSISKQAPSVHCTR